MGCEQLVHSGLSFQSCVCFRRDSDPRAIFQGLKYFQGKGMHGEGLALGPVSPRAGCSFVQSILYVDIYCVLHSITNLKETNSPCYYLIRGCWSSHMVVSVHSLQETEILQLFGIWVFVYAHISGSPQLGQLWGSDTALGDGTENQAHLSSAQWHSFGP